MNNASEKTQTSKTPMTDEAARRIQSAEARHSGGTVKKDSFAANAQRQAARNNTGHNAGR